MYKCEKVVLHSPHNLIKYNCRDDYKYQVSVDACLANEIQCLWSNGVITNGCCCGHGTQLGYIGVAEESVDKMLELGYQFYIYPDELGGVDRRDAFIPKSTYHIYDGYSKGFMG